MKGVGVDAVSARLGLLDLQMLDADDLPIGRVDDVELAVAESGDVSVVALACGQRALGRRLGGTLGRTLEATTARFDANDSADRGGVARIEADLVQELSSVVKLLRPLRELPGVAGLERWLAAHLIGRLPGAGTPAASDETTTLDGPTGPLLLSDVLAATVHDQAGSPLGLAHDVRLGKGDGRHGPVVGPVTGLVVGGTGWRSRLAHAWGYTEGRSHGPALLGALLQPEAFRARVVPVSAVLSWRPTLTVAGPLDRYPLLSEQVSS